jgi:hypothetical protein
MRSLLSRQMARVFGLEHQVIERTFPLRPV